MKYSNECLLVLQNSEFEFERKIAVIVNKFF